jgi:NADPH-dependent curcumin reductase CurA
MNGPTYRSQLSAGDVMSGFTLCEVVDANGTEGPEGAIVACEAGWQECEDARVQRIYAGANEVMKGIIAKSM